MVNAPQFPNKKSGKRILCPTASVQQPFKKGKSWAIQGECLTR